MRRPASLALLLLCFGLLSAGTARAQGPPPPPVPPLPQPPVPAENPITDAKRVLGKILFWDEQLSSDDSIACGTCHLTERAGSDPRLARHPAADRVAGTPDDVFGSPGVAARDPDGLPLDHELFGFAPQVTLRATQAIVGTQYAAEQFWDGRARGIFDDPETGARLIPFGGGLETQALGPILSNVEMAREDRTWADVLAKLEAVQPLALASDVPPDMAAALAAFPGYPALFAAAFGDDEITPTRIAFAIATYERTLVPNRAPWDLFLAGQPGALTPPQLAGWTTFQGSPCAGCHRPPQFSDGTFHNVGVRPWQEDAGRMDVTGNFADRGAFKSPTLRNVGLKASFMHSGRLESLEQVLDFYQQLNGQQQFPDGRAPGLPIALPPGSVPNLVDFLRNGLTDPRVANARFPFDRPTLRSELPPEPLALLRCDASGACLLEVDPGAGIATDGQRLFRGTFPTRAGVAQVLGTRGPGMLDAYDHGETGCGLIQGLADVTTVVDEPGSFYFLVGSVVNGTCAGLGRACRPLTAGGQDCSFGRPHPVVNCVPCSP